jgi:hypothetical protein
VGGISASQYVGLQINAIVSDKSPTSKGCEIVLRTFVQMG